MVLCPSRRKARRSWFLGERSWVCCSSSPVDIIQVQPRILYASDQAGAGARTDVRNVLRRGPGFSRWSTSPRYQDAVDGQRSAASQSRRGSHSVVFDRVPASGHLAVSVVKASGLSEQFRAHFRRTSKWSRGTAPARGSSAALHHKTIRRKPGPHRTTKRKREDRTAPGRSATRRAFPDATESVTVVM